jgi:adenosylcobinamide amidohydrolase
MIEEGAVRPAPEVVVVVTAQPLAVLSSVVRGGGCASARAVVNLHVGNARFGGPASELGWSVAQAAGRALHAGISGRRERNG